MGAAGHLAPRCYDNWLRLKRRLLTSCLSLRCKVVSVAHAINCKKRTGRAIRRLWDAAAGGQERRAASARQSLAGRLRRRRLESVRYSSAVTSAKAQTL